MPPQKARARKPLAKIAMLACTGNQALCRAGGSGKISREEKVAMISLPTAGQSLNKGAMRMLGTLVALTAALAFIAWFAQDRWWFISVLSVHMGFCTYMAAGNKRQYFWFCCAFVCLVICAHAAGDLANAFDVAVLRVQQTGMGILVYTLVSIFL